MVVIRAFGKEANYLRDLPLHHSQKEVETTDIEKRFGLLEGIAFLCMEHDENERIRLLLDRFFDR